MLRDEQHVVEGEGGGDANLRGRERQVVNLGFHLMSVSGRLAVALLVLLAAAARTRIVATHFRLIPPHRLHHIVATGTRGTRRTSAAKRRRRGGRNRRATPAEGRPRLGARVVHRERRCATRGGPWNGRGVLIGDRPQQEEIADDVLFDAPFHILEER